MKTELHKLIRMTMLGLALCSNSLPVWAGTVSLPQVSVTPYSASGSMVGARYSADNQQYIGCQFWNISGPYVTCGARDSTGKTFFCYSTEPRHAAAVKAITDSSRISVGSTTSSPAICNQLTVDNYSDYLK